MASMGKWLLTLGVLIMGGASSAWAAAVTYGFSVSQYTCLEAQCGDRSYFEPKLSSMTMTLDGSRQEVNADLGVPDIGGNASGVLALDFIAWGVQADPAQGTCSGTFFCDIDLDLVIGPLLYGSFLLGTTSDTVMMSASSDGWWSGRIYSDNPMTNGDVALPLFRGQWQVINDVPEPGSALLLLTAVLACLTARATRRVPR